MALQDCHGAAVIYGIIAGGVAAPVAPIVALGIFDFVNGIYDWQGTSITASQVIDQTGWIGVDGLSVPGSAAAGAEILYAATGTFLADINFTAVMEIEILNALEADILTITNAGGSYDVSAIVYGQSEWDAHDNDGVTQRWASDDSHSLTTGIHKFAITRTTAAGLSVSVDGNAVQVSTGSSSLPWEGFPMTEFYLGGYNSYTSGAVNIRSVAFYDPQADSALPGLSA